MFCKQVLQKLFENALGEDFFLCIRIFEKKSFYLDCLHILPSTASTLAVAQLHKVKLFVSQFQSRL